MGGNLVNAALTSTLIVSSVFFTPPATQAASFTQAIPENNYILHTITDGESLSEIAKNSYGSEDYWTTAWNDNAWIGNPDSLTKGELLKIRTNKPTKIEKLHAELQTKWDALQASQNPEAIDAAVSIEQPTPLPQPPSSYDDVYKAAGAKFGIPWQILYGIHMTETGGRNGAIMSGSGSGAQGPMQFMPGTFAAYAVDGDGDGKTDINDAVDAIYTAANFLARHGDLMTGLRSYGGNIAGTLALARDRGFNL